ncbi:hypothetical protein [Castellaniella sp. UC4442_H9]
MPLKKKAYARTQSAKRSVAQVLRDRGENVNGRESAVFLIAVCTGRFWPPKNGESSTQYFLRIVESVSPKPEKYVGEKAQPSTVNRMTLEEWTPTPHPRAAEIDGLPTQVSMSGFGNGTERHNGFGRGK